MGRLGTADCGFDGLTGSIYELAEDEKRELEEIRKWKRDKEKIANL